MGSPLDIYEAKTVTVCYLDQNEKSDPSYEEKCNERKTIYLWQASKDKFNDWSHMDDRDTKNRNTSQNNWKAWLH